MNATGRLRVENATEVLVVEINKKGKGRRSYVVLQITDGNTLDRTETLYIGDKFDIDLNIDIT